MHCCVPCMALHVTPSTAIPVQVHKGGFTHLQEGLTHGIQHTMSIFSLKTQGPPLQFNKMKIKWGSHAHQALLVLIQSAFCLIFILVGKEAHCYQHEHEQVSVHIHGKSLP